MKKPEEATDPRWHPFYLRRLQELFAFHLIAIVGEIPGLNKFISDLVAGNVSKFMKHQVELAHLFPGAKPISEARARQMFASEEAARDLAEKGAHVFAEVIVSIWLELLVMGYDPKTRKAELRFDDALLPQDPRAIARFEQIDADVRKLMHGVLQRLAQSSPHGMPDDATILLVEYFKRLATSGSG